MTTTANAPDTDLSYSSAFLSAHYLRRLPPFRDDAPADLVSAVNDYLDATEAWFLAEAEHEAATSQVLNARRSEAEAIRVAVLRGEDPATVEDHIVATQRDQRRTHAIAGVRAGEVKQAAARLIAVALSHRATEYAAARPAIDQAADKVQQAQAALREAQAQFNGAVDIAAWWDALALRHFPNFGTATRDQIQSVAADYTVTDEPIGA